MGVPVDLTGLWGQSNCLGTPPGKGNTSAGYQAAPSNKYPGQAMEWEDGFTPTIMDLADGRSPVAGWGTSEPYKALPGSAWPAFFNTYCRFNSRKQVAVRCAIGGTSVLAANTNGQSGKGDWSPTATGEQGRFQKAIDRMLAAKADILAAGDTINSINIIWHGGERDALEGNGLDDGTFLTQFGDLAGRARTALSWPTLKFYVARVGHPDYAAAPDYQQYEDELQKVRDQQDLACSTRDGMVMAYTDCIHFQDWGLMSQKDHIHYSQPGYNLMGEGLAYFIAADQGLTEIQPPEPEFRTSQIGRRLWNAPSVPPVPDWIAPGTYTWTVPHGSGITSIDLQGEAPGGGGGGGGALNRGSGGGSGEYGTYTSISVAEGDVIEVTVGSPGNYGQTNISQNATAGGDITVKKNGTTIFVLKGGGPGGNNAGTVGAGGTGGSGGTRTAGNPGLIGSGAAGNRGKGGDGYTGFGAAGGAGEVANGVNGNDGGTPGGGGSGGGITATAIHGGLGGYGRLKITTH